MLQHRLTFLLLSIAVLAPTSSGQSVTTIFTGGNSGTTTWTNQFDITVLNPAGVTITAFDVNCENTRSGGVGSNFTLTVWATALGGSYVGNQTNPAAWTQISQGSGISQLLGTPTSVDVDDFHLPTGQFGIALEYNGTAMAYTNGTGANQSFANADIQLDLGSSTTGLFGAPLYDPRVWNGTVYYFAGNATVRSHGVGCAGTAGSPALAPVSGSLPQQGMTFSLEVTNVPLPTAPVSLSLGVSSTSWLSVPLPLDLALIGATGCYLLSSREGDVPGSGTAGVARYDFPVPTDPGLVGGNIYFQALILDVGANPGNLSVTNSIDAYIGA